MLELGNRLLELAPQQLDSIPLEGNVRAALEEIRSIRAHGARKRQLKYLGKLLRQADAAPIREALDTIRSSHRQTIARHHLSERWRDRLLEEDNSTLSEFIDAYPHADRQSLHQLIRAARQERAAARAPRQQRELFRLLREIIG